MGVKKGGMVKKKVRAKSGGKKSGGKKKGGKKIWG